MSTITNDHKSQNHYYVSWQQFDQYCKYLAQRIVFYVAKRPDFHFDHIVWIVPTLSAMPLATAVIHALTNLHGIQSIAKSNIHVYDVDNDCDKTRSIIQQLSQLDHQTMIVYVDDIIDSGQSFRRAYQVMFDQAIKCQRFIPNIAIVTLLNRSNQLPDNVKVISAVTDNSNDYIVFPWEYLT